MGEDLAFSVADFTAGQSDGNVATIVGKCPLISFIRMLHHASQAGADRNALQSLDLASLLLYGKRLILHCLQPGNEFRLLLADAFAGERFLHFLVLLFQRFDALRKAFQFRQQGGGIVGSRSGCGRRRS